MTALAEPPLVEHERSENLVRVVWALAWPSVALSSLQVINNLLDRGFIGHLDASALTGYGGVTNVLFLMFSIAFALATAATAIVARAFGAGERWEYQLASRQSISMAIVFGVLFGLLTYFGGPWIANFILPAHDLAAIDQMIGFLKPFSFGLPAMFMISTLAGSLRGAGDTKSPMVIGGVQILLHASLNFLLVFHTRKVLGFTVPGAGMGLAGGATALAISSWMSVIGYLAYSVRTPLGGLYRIELPKLDWAERILKIAVPAAINSSLRTFSLMAFTLILALAPNGSIAIAAMSVSFSVESIMFMPSFGLAAAAGALVGQSLGMESPRRAERIGWIAGLHGALVTGALAIPIFVFAPVIANTLIENKPLIAEQSAQLMRMLCVTEMAFAYSMVLFGAMQGAGDTSRPMWISIFALWGLRIPLALVLAPQAGQHIFSWLTLPVGVGLGATGSWIAMSSTQGIQGILAYFAFRQGAWKLKKV